MKNSSIQEVISIVGTTASGKSAAALKLSDALINSQHATGIEIISADSRQVYRGLELITGADIPKDAEQMVDETLPYHYFKLAGKNIFIHGISVISPLEEWSAVHFQRLAYPVLERAAAHGRVVIVVGGTGLYQTHLLNTELIEQPAPDSELRAQLGGMSLAQLQSQLRQVDSVRFESLNDSDRENPRRLVRHIEKSLQPKIELPTKGFRPTNSETLSEPAPQRQTAMALLDWSQKFVGLFFDREKLAIQIADRVRQRFDAGALSEAQQLVDLLQTNGIAAGDVPAFSSCGIKELLAYGESSIEKEACLDLWTHRELAYAKRQMTWWKKQPDVTWFDIQEKDWYAAMEKQVLNWYH